MRSLDPELFLTDEDRINVALGGCTRSELESLPGYPAIGPAPTTPVDLIAWMEKSHSVVDQSAWVLFSLCRSTVAYRDAVPVGTETAVFTDPDVPQVWGPADRGVPLPNITSDDAVWPASAPYHKPSQDLDLADPSEKWRMPPK